MLAQGTSRGMGALSPHHQPDRASGHARSASEVAGLPRMFDSVDAPASAAPAHTPPSPAEIGSGDNKDSHMGCGPAKREPHRTGVDWPDCVACHNHASLPGGGMLAHGTSRGMGALSPHHQPDRASGHARSASEVAGLPRMFDSVDAPASAAPAHTPPSPAEIGSGDNKDSRMGCGPAKREPHRTGDTGLSCYGCSLCHILKYLREYPCEVLWPYACPMLDSVDGLPVGWSQ